ncbi:MULTISPECIES: trypsin-like peptidase domain-containing protein [Streptomyces]|uniref:S1C family serine protease n=1 Tax=Streptomyces TaxID=1883 RepID=UPI00103D37B9|nr:MULTISPECIES: trypsin-like peptidase domain-containing protein [Streptomyces]MBT3076884.1 trypsin-like peptidase domain-containing protein [Streptomyces sp. COG21]MBT3082200.1 trypsin-like peptidase domain-containing protein [Streptomyces sp. COG20]MBT3091080.1 trypsin-like peptidase domain-containing protein [Streptomyces sp. CYG21]MBT3098948.1 trypsin-like peptidase domain-containing protein [Streptomyces sp. CBG30]MBT3104171.1 trypsin-like peptidase domain-containing protein [Streptomyce
MSTENEGTEGNAVPAVPSVPPAPPVPATTPDPAADNVRDEPKGPAADDVRDEPAGTAAAGATPPAATPAHADAPRHTPTAQGTPQDHAATAHTPQPHTPPHPHQPPHSPYGAAPEPPAGAASWPPPPPAVPSYASGGAAHTPGGGVGNGSGGGPVWGAPSPQPGHTPSPATGKRGAGGLIAAVAVAALVAGGIGGALGFWAADRNDNGSSGSSTTVSASDSPRDLKRPAGTVAGVAAKALPSVVTIDAQGGDGEGGTGTGFVYDKEGHILTNNHVVASAAESGELSATFSDGKKYAAEVVGRAQGYDVAVLKLKNPPAGLTPLPLGNSESVAVGDSTIAIGAPFGLSNTVTTGIISAKNRPVASGDGSSSKNSYMSALQTDASINPGNSGGPLLDATGAVIGINSAIQSTGGGLGQSQAGSIGLGFAIPINQAKNVAEQLIKTGKPVYPVIGATVSMEEKTGGAAISPEGAAGTPSVTPNGPAAKAGLKPGDVITKFNDTVIDSGPTLIGEIWTRKPGEKVTLTYERDGKTSTAEVTLGQREGDS